MQGLADGYFVLPYTIQNYLADQALWPKLSTDLPEFAEAEAGVQKEIDRLMGIQGKRSVDSIHKELGHILWEHVGMGRTKEGLEEGVEEDEGSPRGIQQEPLHPWQEGRLERRVG